MVFFIFLYAMLIGSAAGLWTYSTEFTYAGTWDRLLIGSLISLLIVIAASVMTRMRMEFFAQLSRLNEDLSISRKR